MDEEEDREDVKDFLFLSPLCTGAHLRLKSQSPWPHLLILRRYNTNDGDGRRQCWPMYPAPVS